MTRRSPTLTAQLNEGYIELNFDDAAALGVSGGETVRVISRRGAISLKTRITHIIPAGTVFIPFHFAEAAANVLTSGSSLDPMAKIPELKVCAVRIEKVG
jgi:formate dehydrogenase major subunit